MQTRKKTTTIETPAAYRLAALELASVRAEDGGEDDDRTVTLAFSSEAPVERFFGIEILDHGRGSIRLDWIASGRAPLLFNHDVDDQIGVVEGVTIGSDRILRARVRFSKSARAQEILADIRDGIRTNVSVGYQVYRMIVESVEGDVETYRVTDWEPFEISIVTIPADREVGVGRGENTSKTVEAVIEADVVEGDLDDAAGGRGSADVSDQVSDDEQAETRGGSDADPAQVQPETDDHENERGHDMSDQNQTPAQPAVDAKAIAAEARAQETARVREIDALGRQHNLGDAAGRFIQDGKSVEEFQRFALEEISKRDGNPVSVAVADEDPQIGMTDKDVRNFSLLRLVGALANPGDRRMQDLAGFELECSAAAAERLHASPKGAILPADMLRAPINPDAMQTRDMNVGTASQGGNLVATNLLSMSFIEILQNKMSVMRAGAMMLNDLVGDIAIPKQTGGATAYWITSEGGDPTESTPAIGQVSLTPKTVGAYTDITRKLLLQSSIDVEAFVRYDLARVLGLAIDLAALSGSGASGQPTGVENTTGINTQSFATDDQPTYAELVGMETSIAADNADVDGMAYIVPSGIRGHCKTTEKASGTAQFIWEPGNMINGYPAIVSNQVTAGDAFLGNWMDLIIGMWGGLEINVDTAALAKSGGVRVIGLQSLDTAVRHPESFTHGS